MAIKAKMPKIALSINLSDRVRASGPARAGATLTCALVLKCLTILAIIPVSNKVIPTAKIINTAIPVHSLGLKFWKNSLKLNTTTSAPKPVTVNCGFGLTDFNNRDNLGFEMGYLFWTDSRRRLISKALINLFQALLIALFISEAFLKAAIPWRVAFILTTILSMIGAILVCPKENSEED